MSDSYLTAVTLVTPLPCPTAVSWRPQSQSAHWSRSKSPPSGIICHQTGLHQSIPSLIEQSPLTAVAPPEVRLQWAADSSEL